MRRHYLTGLFFSLVAPFGVLMADENSPVEDFKAGVAAYDEGNLDTARQKLEQARGGGLNSSALTYNLGVVYYRLELYDLAEEEFRRLLNTSHAPLARYNLGLIYQSRGDAAGARAWFTQAASTASNTEIQSLAQRQLSRPSDPSPNRPPSSETIAFFTVAAGYDDNIAGTPSTETSDETGPFGDLLASMRAYLPATDQGTLKLDATAYTRQYPNHANFDTIYLSASGTWQRVLDEGRLDSGLSLTGLWFGGDLLERQARLQFEYLRTECFGSSALRLDCRMSVYAAQARGGSRYQAYDGNLYGAVAAAKKAFGPWSIEAVYRLDVDRRDDLETDQEFFSLSPTRHRLSANVGYRLSELWRLQAEQAFRTSRYADPHRLVIDGQTETETREDDQFRTTVRASYQLTSLWELGLELSWIDNQSSIERYDYNRTEGFISLDAVF